MDLPLLSAVLDVHAPDVAGPVPENRSVLNNQDAVRNGRTRVCLPFLRSIFFVEGDHAGTGAREDNAIDNAGHAVGASRIVPLQAELTDVGGVEGVFRCVVAAAQDIVSIHSPTGTRAVTGFEGLKRKSGALANKG